MRREWSEGAGEGRRGAVVWGLCAGGSLLFVILVLLAPLLEGALHAFSADVIYRAFGYVCHQQPARSFYLGAHPLAVCARCSGLYAGVAAAVLLYPFLRPLSGPAATLAPPRFWFILALLPTAFDFGLDFIGLRANTHFSRAATGVLLGAATAFYLLPGLIDLARADLRRLLATEDGRPGRGGLV